jgi:hypothetical protein
MQPNRVQSHGEAVTRTVQWWHTFRQQEDHHDAPIRGNF